MRTEAIHRIADSSIAEAILLKKAELRALAYPEDRLSKMLVCFDAAERRLGAANELFDGKSAVSPTLYREAGLMFMAAAVILHGGATNDALLRGDDVVAQFRRLDPPWPCPRPWKELDWFFALVASPDPLAFDRLPPDEMFERTLSVRAIVDWLRETSRPLTLREVKMQRRLRVGGLAAALVGGLVWGLASLLAPKNIALHKPVLVSSVHPAAVSPPPGLTDGVVTGSYGVATSQEESPWVAVDLLDVYRLDKIKIYNRGDGWFDDTLPMTLELSENGTDYVEVAVRTWSFGQWMPWTFSANGKKARYIRVRGAHGRWVALSELEAFGKK